jgi:hypothetical protein
MSTEERAMRRTLMLLVLLATAGGLRLAGFYETAFWVAILVAIVAIVTTARS